MSTVTKVLLWPFTSWIRGIISAVAFLLFLVIMVVVLAFIFINPIAKEAIVRGSNYAMGVDTKLDSASIGIFSGKFGLSGLNISNPSDKGFKTPHFMTLGTGSLDMPVMRVFSKDVTIEELKLADVHLNLEKKGDVTNYGVIMDNLKKLESGETTKTEPAKKNEKVYRIKHLIITNIKVHAEGYPPSDLNLTIPKIEMQNIGTDNEGVAMAELQNIILQAILQNASHALVAQFGAVGKEIGGALNSGLGGLKGLSSSGVKMLGEAGKVLPKDLTKPIENLHLPGLPGQKPKEEKPPQ